MENETDQVSQVYGNNAFPLFINVPEGVFNSPFNQSWNASGINPAFLTAFPELAADTYATIGLEGSASSSGIAGAADPSLVEDPEQNITPFFLDDGETSVLSNSIIGATWYVLTTASNASPQDDDLRVLVMQVTTTGSIEGQLNYIVFPEGDGQAVEKYSTPFEGAGTFQGELVIEVVGCMDYTACNYNPEANLQYIGLCEYGNPEDYDECGVCNGLGAIYACGCSPIPEGDCDCEGSQNDALGVCGGECSADEDADGICDDVDDCIGSLDACGVCNGPGDVFACGCFPIPEGDCDCQGTVEDECGVCGGSGIPAGECDCEGNIVDECGVCGGQNSCFGCTDSGACNFDQTATIENGSCEYVTCAGCTDSSACNFDDYATIDDESCFFACCLNQEACNYFPDPSEDVGGCDFSCYCIPGEGPDSPCFNVQGGVEVITLIPIESLEEGDSIVIVEICSYTCGCTDPFAFNYSAESNADNGLCEYFQTSCDFVGNSAWEEYDPGIYAQSQPIHMLGAPDFEELVFHVPEVLTDSTTGSAFAVMAWENLTISGMPNGLTFDSFPASITGNSQLCVSYSGTPLELGTFEVNLTGEMILDFFGSPYSIGNVSSSLNIVVESNPNPILGCTYEHAVNHSPIASVDDGSCIFKGCTDPSASNYEPYASVDDGTCNSEPCEDGTASNMGDLNNDGAVGSSDLLQFLSVYGVSYLN